jgi:hypothetical protein
LLHSKWEGVNLSFEWFIKFFRLICLCAAIIGPDLGSITHTVSLFYIFHLFLCMAFGVEDTVFSRKWARRSQVCMTNLKGLIRACVRYAHQSYSRTTGLEDSKVYFSSTLFWTQFWPLFMPQMTNSRVVWVVKDYWLLKGFHLICSSL